MDSQDSIRELFDRALDLPENEREEFVRSRAPNAAIAATVLDLLAHHAAATGFMRSPASVPLNDSDPERIAEFEIVRVLGHGGMGVVYEAFDTILKRRVAIKVLAPHLLGSEQAIARLRQEARAVAQLDHPNVVAVYRCAEDAGRQYIVMEYVPGHTLAHQLLQEQQPPLESRSRTEQRDHLRVVVSVLESIAHALEHAHSHGVTHRDIKPSNILVGVDRRVKLTDFGIAHIATEPTVAQVGRLAGTAPYMSPEQATASSQPIDHRTDIYSFGVVMYECLTHRLPYKGETIQQVLDSIRMTEPPRLRSLNPAIPRDLETICHKAMEKHPLNRYQTASQVRADLMCWRRGDPILAMPPSRARRTRRWIARRRRPLAAVFIVCLTVLFGTLAWLAESRRRAQLCTISVATRDSGAGVTIWAVEDSGSPRVPLHQGAAPYSARVEPGVYRVVVRAAEGFAETTVVLSRPGDTQQLYIPIVSADEATAGMAFVQSGLHQLGAPNREGIQAARTVELPSFYIDKEEVSNAQYLAFVQATGRELPLHWREFGYDDALAEHPIVEVTWEDAEAYARWVGKRLPTAEEWEAAMRSPDGRVLPWGNAEPAGLRTATLEDREHFISSALSAANDQYAVYTVPVGSSYDLATPLGIRHGASNVQEYTATIINGPTMQVVVKGASWLNVPKYADSARFATRPLLTVDHAGQPVLARSMDLGFRCARSASAPGER